MSILTQYWFRHPISPPDFFFIGGINHFSLYSPPDPSPLQPLSPPPLQLPLFAFLLSFVVNLLQIKYQQSKSSPFDDNPLTMSIVVFLILWYFLPHGARSTLS
ncbi:hypothetical protein Dimus_034862 [Dionaea muscipula]